MQLLIAGDLEEAWVESDKELELELLAPVALGMEELEVLRVELYEDNSDALKTFPSSLFRSVPQIVQVSTTNCALQGFVARNNSLTQVGPG